MLAPCGALYGVGDFWRVPPKAVDPRLAIRAERAAQPEQTGVSPGGDDASRSILDVDETISRDAGETECRLGQQFTGHRLHRVAPELSNLHVS